MRSSITVLLLILLLSWAKALFAAVEDTPQGLAISAPDHQQTNTCVNTNAAAPFPTDIQNASTQYHTLAHQFLDSEKAVSTVTPATYALLDRLLAEAQATLQPMPKELPAEQALSFARQTLDQIDCLLLRHGFVYPGRGAVQLLSESLTPTHYNNFRYLNEVYRQPHNIRRRAFINARHFGPFYVADCDLAAFLYVAIGEVLGYPIQLVDIPNHIFVRWTFADGRYINYETMDGLVTNDTYYQKKWAIPQAFMVKGGILQAMNTHEAIAYHDAAVAEAWSWQQAYVPMHEGLLRAIAQDASRPFALHQLASYFMAAAPEATENNAKAIHYAQQAADVFPSGDNLDTLACAYAHAHDFKQATTIAKQAIKVDYAPFESNIAGHLKRFALQQDCDFADFGRDLTPFRASE